MTDWELFREACLTLIAGGNPYAIQQYHMQYFNPMWTLLPLIPLALLPWLTGLIANGILSIMSMLFISHRLEIGLWGFFWLAISPMHVQSILYGNIEWLALIGILFPAPIAMFFFSIKPQATIGLIMLVILNQWQTKRWKGVMITMLPVTIAFFLSFIIWGLPPIPVNNPAQRSYFPLSLLVGLPALIMALKSQNEKWALFSSPFLSPYVTFHGYLPILFAFNGKWVAIITIVLFIPFILGIF